MVEIGDFEFYGVEGAEDRVRELIEQRDELLEALQCVKNWHNGVWLTNMPQEVIDVIDAAISRALGENKE